MATQNQGTRQVKRKPVRLLCLPKLQLYTLQLICQVWDLIFLGGYHCLCSYFNFFILLWTKYLQQKQITLFFHLICLNKNIYLIFNLKLLISNKSDCSQCLGKKQLFWQLQQFQVVSNKLSLETTNSGTVKWYVVFFCQTSLSVHSELMTLYTDILLLCKMILSFMSIFNRPKPTTILAFVAYHTIFKEGAIGVLDECENIFRSPSAAIPGVTSPSATNFS